MKKVADIRSFFKKTLSSSPGSDQRNDDTFPRGDCPIMPTPALPPSMSEAEASTNPSTEKMDRTEEKEPEPSDLGTLESGPKQPTINFPKTQSGDRTRSFSDVYYKNHPWLEYSVEKDRTYCFECRHFATGDIRDQNEKFTKTGFFNWIKMKDAIEKHEKSDMHLECHQKYLGYQMANAVGDVREKVANQSQEAIKEKKQYLTVLADIISYLSCQGMPLRGHDEKADSANKGNFIELCELFAKHNDSFAKHFHQRVNYHSPDVQNEIIDIAAGLTLQEIGKEVCQCGFYSLMVDEARCYKEQQLSVVLRYVRDLQAVERFLGFLNCSTARDRHLPAKVSQAPCDVSKFPPQFYFFTEKLLVESD